MVGIAVVLIIMYILMNCFIVAGGTMMLEQAVLFMLGQPTSPEVLWVGFGLLVTALVFRLFVRRDPNNTKK